MNTQFYIQCIVDLYTALLLFSQNTHEIGKQ